MKSSIKMCLNPPIRGSIVNKVFPFGFGFGNRSQSTYKGFNRQWTEKFCKTVSLQMCLNPPIRGSIEKRRAGANGNRKRSQSPYKGFNSCSDESSYVTI